MTDSAETVAPPAREDELLYGFPVTLSRDQRVIHPPRDQWQAAAQTLFDDNWTMLVLLTAVDYLSHATERRLPVGVNPERFEVVAGLVRYDTNERIRMRTQVPGDEPVIGSLYEIYPGCDFQEREVFDMFGITFEGHPDLSRILMPETWVGHPLRKDYAQGVIPVQFKGPQGGEVA